MRGALGIVLVLVVSCSGRSTPPSGPVASPPDAAVVTNPPTPDASATSCTGSAPSPDHVCVQDCGPPVVRDTDPPPGWSWLSPDEVDARNRGGCPRCLPAAARIATPGGEVAIAELVAGARVYTVDRAGRRVEAIVLEVRARPAPSGHALIRATLADGRVVSGSAEHPVADGRELGALRPGDPLDGDRVVEIEVVPLLGDRTWDLRVSGQTGLYLADGVALRSTL